MLDQSLGPGTVFSPTCIKFHSGLEKKLHGNPKRASGLLPAIAVNLCKCLTWPSCCQGIQTLTLNPTLNSSPNWIKSSWVSQGQWILLNERYCSGGQESN